MAHFNLAWRTVNVSMTHFNLAWRTVNPIQDHFNLAWRTVNVSMANFNLAWRTVNPIWEVVNLVWRHMLLFSAKSLPMRTGDEVLRLVTIDSHRMAGSGAAKMPFGPPNSRILGRRVIFDG
jgi:hypothetical protein